MIKIQKDQKLNLVEQINSKMEVVRTGLLTTINSLPALLPQSPDCKVSYKALLVIQLRLESATHVLEVEDVFKVLLYRCISIVVSCLIDHKTHHTDAQLKLVNKSGNLNTFKVMQNLELHCCNSVTC